MKSAIANPASITRISSDLSPYTGEWASNEVVHLLKRLCFGATKSDIEYFSKKTLSESLDELLTNYSVAPNPPVNDYATDDKSVPFGQVWTDTQGDGTMQGLRRLSFKGWWLALMRNNSRKSIEKLTLFFHNLIPVEADSVGVARYTYLYNTILRKNCVGNYKVMLREITTSAAMLRYLNGDSNTKTAPDENYGRELQELFTVGKGKDSKYTEDDIKAAARVLTGFRTDNITGNVYFDPKRHDTNDKIFSSFYNNTVIKGLKDVDGAKELDELLDMIFNSQETSKHICRSIYMFFVYYEIDEFVEQNVIDPLAKIFRENNYELKPVFTALFSSSHFFDNANRACLIKSHIDHCVSFIRELGIKFADTDKLAENYYFNGQFRNHLVSVQQEHGDPPSVSGWPAYYQSPSFHRLWANTDSYPKRITFTDRLLTVGYTRNNITVAADLILYVSQLNNPSDPNDLIKETLLSIYAYPTTQEFKDFIKKTYLLSGQETDGYWTEAWNNYISEPTNKMFLNEIKTRLVPLFKYLMKLPEYHLA